MSALESQVLRVRIERDPQARRASFPLRRATGIVVPDMKSYSYPYPDTPCVAVCTTTFDDICRGCGRTVDEVAQWVFMTQEQKDEIINEAYRMVDTYSIDKFYNNILRVYKRAIRKIW